jgi:Flp pilus assembly protein TadD
LDALNKELPKLGQEHKEELKFWYDQLAKWEGEHKAAPGEEARYRPLYAQAAQALLLVLSAVRQEEAVSLCPGEVKYHVYLGLAYEELFKRSALSPLKLSWFERAERAYAKGAALNPRNAYYHGNLGRLYSLRAEDPAFLEKSEAAYGRAIGLAPVTRLFYDNLLLLYAEQGRLEKAEALVRPMEAKDGRLASRLYGSAGTLFAQSGELSRQRNEKVKAASYQAAARDMLGRAQRLDPSNADYPYVLAALAFSDGKEGEARAFLDQALGLNPGHEPSLKLKSMLK